MLPLLSCLLFAACAPASAPEGLEVDAFDAIGPGEEVRFLGTEPFWGGEVSGTRLRYSTPDDIEGRTIAVERFAGNGGLSFTGRLDGRRFDLLVTPGTCSDGMSDRSYPYTATLRLGDNETRSGCAWTERQGFSGEG